MLRILAALGVLFFAAAAHAGERVALLMGNAKYAHATVLANPVRDAEDFGAALMAAGFAVTLVTDADRIAAKAALASFAEAAKGSEIAVFYYAGHGFTMGGRDYIVPVDAKLETAAAVPEEALALDEAVKDIAAAARAAVVFFDSNRDDPLGGGKTGKGEAAPAPGNLFIGYATSPGAVAEDGKGRNGPFAAALIKHVTEKGVTLDAAMSKVRKDVFDTTEGRQMVWTNSSLQNEVFLGGK